MTQIAPRSRTDQRHARRGVSVTLKPAPTEPQRPKASPTHDGGSRLYTR